MYSLSAMMLTAVLIVGVSVCLIPNVIWFLWWAIAEMFHFSTPRYAPFAWTAAGLVAAVWLIMAYGFFVGRFRLEVKPTTYTNAQLPKAFEGYKIVHISDLHLSTYDDRPAALQRIVDSINAQQPDLLHGRFGNNRRLRGKSSYRYLAPTARYRWGGKRIGQP